MSCSLYKKVLFIALMISIIGTSGCVPASSVANVDDIKSETGPIGTGEEVALSRLAYGIGEPPYTVDELFLTDFTGIKTVMARDAFDGVFVPQAIQGRHSFISAADVVADFRTDYTIINRNVFKRTDAKYFHKQPTSGMPLLREDGTILAVGIAGVKGYNAYLGLPQLGAGKVNRARPEGYGTGELESTIVHALLWDEKDAHALFVLGNGNAVYLVTSMWGKERGHIELTGGIWNQEFTPRVWKDPAARDDFIILSAPGGFYKIDPVNYDAEFHSLPGNGLVLGITVDRLNIVWVKFGPGIKGGSLYFRDVETMADSDSISFGDKAYGVENVLYSYREDCIFFESDSDIWRMDMASGVQGRFTDSPETVERLLWSQ